MLRLVFTPHGTAELWEGETSQLWASDNDPDFVEEFDPDEFLSADDDEAIMDYLVERGTVGESVDYEVEEQALENEETDDSDED